MRRRAERERGIQSPSCFIDAKHEAAEGAANSYLTVTVWKSAESLL